jgi:putative membrane protein
MAAQIAESLGGLPAFLAFFATAAVLTVLFVLIYTRITRHDELALIKQNVPAAAVAFSGSLIGFSLPLASAINNSADLIDMILWGIVALVVQLIAYVIVRLFMPKVSQRIEAGELAAGIWLAAASLAAGIINAASMTT